MLQRGKRTRFRGAQSLRASADRGYAGAGTTNGSSETKAGEVKAGVRTALSTGLYTAHAFAGRALTLSDCLIPAHSLTAIKTRSIFPVSRSLGA